MTALWVVLMIGFLVVEGIAPGLVSIWFALGALAALISALLGAQVWLQAVWFIVISVLALVLTRPLAKKYVNSRTQATNADMLIGQECIVTETIDKLHGTGAVSVGGKVWTARADDPERIIEKDSVAVVERIEGVKLIVRTKE
ncbi:MAG: NfeD family protein [Oscillospiraceae bacterium]|nr:NfeD family protein [Oscillospiraceae bacterium]